MKINLKRHKLLKILGNKDISFQLRKEGVNSIGVSFEDIYKGLKCNEYELKKITSELYENEEIDYHDAYNIVGLYIKKKGLASYSNKKYISLYNNWIINSVKTLIQIIIPILSLLIAFVAISLKIKNINTETNRRLIQAENKIESLEKRVNNLNSQLSLKSK